MKLPLEKQVSSLELSKRLKELGVPQESLFYWYKGKMPNVGEVQYCIFGECGDELLASAFTVAELGEMLPHRMKEFPIEDFYNDGILCEYLSFIGVKKGYGMFYELDNDMKYPKDLVWSENESDARALLLIHLIENKLMAVPSEGV